MADGYQAGEAAKAIAEAAAAGGLGMLGALARVAATVDDKPMLRLATLIRIGGDASLGVGFYLILAAWGYAGVWSMAGAWVAGALGFAACHDVFMRFVKSLVGPGGRR